MEITCHCGNITIQAPTPEQITSCNCSLCSRYSALWGYYNPEQVEIQVPEAGEQVYIWGDREIEFVRCAKCGCVSHYRTIAGEGAPRVAVNFRMAEAELTAHIPVRYFNGKDLL